MKLHYILFIAALFCSVALSAQPVIRINTVDGKTMDILKDSIDDIYFSNHPFSKTYKDYDEVADEMDKLTNYMWYNYQRGFILVGDFLAGNYDKGTTYTFPQDDDDVNSIVENMITVRMFPKIWRASNLAESRIKNAKCLTEAERTQFLGEILVWRALSMFYQVRLFGYMYEVNDVPLLDNIYPFGVSYTSNLQIPLDEYKKLDIKESYDLIVSTLNQAMTLLSPNVKPHRLSSYAAEALLAKVYLTKAGVNGSLSATDLNKAAKHAKNVIDSGKYSLLADYIDNFKLTHNLPPLNTESLIAWQWRADFSLWGTQSFMESDLGMQGINGLGDCWGGFAGPSFDLQNVFGIDARDRSTYLKATDRRIKGTFMLRGLTYEWLWTDKGGFDYEAHVNLIGSQSPTYCNIVKHIYGNEYDHEQALGIASGRMRNGLYTHILRLSDIYLIYAEAKLGASRSDSSDPEVIDALYAVQHRADSTAVRPQSVSWNDIWTERRKELSFEGDRWFDYVRVSYYDLYFCIKDLQSQSVCKDQSGNILSVDYLIKYDSSIGRRYFALPAY